MTFLAAPTVAVPGWITTGLAPAPGLLQPGALQAADVAAQEDDLLFWDDGSVKFAAVTFLAESLGEEPLTTDETTIPVPNRPSPAIVKLPDLWVCVTEISGERYVAQPTGDTMEGFRLQGPLLSEWREARPFFSAESGLTHTWLTVIFDLRQYADGKVSMSAIVENCRNAAGGMVRYGLTLGVGDLVIRDLGMADHPYLARTRQILCVDDEGVEWEPGFLLPDMTPFVEAGAFPEYSPEVWDTVDSGDMTPFSAGVLNPFMPDHGGRPEIAPYPDWAARAIVHRREEQLRFLYAQSDLSGSWPIHVREQDGSMVSIDSRPNYWLDVRAEPGDKPAGNLNETGPLTPDIAHQPSLAFIPYLLTADRFYEEEMTFWANYVLLGTYQDRLYEARGGNQGLLHVNELRGIGWGLRNLADAAAYLPTADPMKWVFVDKVNNNLAWLDANSVGQGPLGVLWHTKRMESQDPDTYDRVWLAQWEANYLAWAIFRANRLGFVGGEMHLQRLLDRQLELFANPVTHDGAASYTMPAGKQVPPGSLLTGGAVEWYETLEEWYVGPCVFSGYYGTDARLSLVMSDWLSAELDVVEHLAYLDQQPLMPEYLRERAGWFIVSHG